MFRRSLLVLTLVFAACVHRATSPTSMLEDAASAAGAADASGRTVALAGFHAWLMQNDPKLAQQRFDAALARDPRDPFALYGEAWLKLRLSRPDGAVAASLDLCERAPGILAQGAPGDAAALLRAALANIHLSRRESAQHEADLDAQGVPQTFT